MAENFRKAYAEYLHIAELFKCGDPNAEILWRNFCHAENGLGIALYARSNPEVMIAEN